MRVEMSGRFNFDAVGSPLTPAAQIVTCAGISGAPLIFIEAFVTSSTAVLSITCTPSFSRSFFVRSDRAGEKLGNKRGPASIKTILIFAAASAWSFLSGPRTNSAKAPAISTPVGPPPTTAIVNAVSSWKRHKSSKRRITSARMERASCTLFIPSANSLTPFTPKSAVAEPSAMIK